MRYMAEDSLDMIQEFGERVAGPTLSRGIARLYSQHTRLRAGTSGLSSWTTKELLTRLGEGEKLLVAGMAAADSLDHRRYLRRAGEIFEWAATSSPAEMPVPVVLLAASAYQLAGYPARASGILSEHPLPDATSQVLAALLRADFPEAQRLLLETWRIDGGEDAVENRIGIALLDHLLHALGVLTAWLRWGEDARIETALITLEKVSHALRYDSDRFSWVLAVLFAAIGRSYQDDALWTVLSPLMTTVAVHSAVTREWHSLRRKCSHGHPSRRAFPVSCQMAPLHCVRLPVQGRPVWRNWLSFGICSGKQACRSFFTSLHREPYLLKSRQACHDPSAASGQPALPLLRSMAATISVHPT